MNTNDKGSSKDSLNFDDVVKTDVCCPHCHRLILLTIDELKDWLKVSERQIHRMISRHELPPRIKLGEKSIRYSVQDINEWLRKKRFEM